MLVTLSAINVVTLLEIVQLCYTLPLWNGLSKVEKLGFYFAMAVPQYFVVLFGDKYIARAQKYSLESASQCRRRGAFVLLYVVISLTLPVGIAILKGIRLGLL